MDSGIFKNVINSPEEAAEFSKGDTSKGRISYIQVPDTVEVKRIRSKTGMNQITFSKVYGIPLRTLQSWESKERYPHKMARILLTVIDKHPEVVIDSTTN